MASDRARIVRERDGQRVSVGASKGQSAKSLHDDVERSFAYGEEMRARGTEEWTSHFRWIGPVRYLAYKEVGPPPWRWPKIGVQPWRGKNHPCVRFIVGWRSTAYALVVMWYGRRAEGTGSE